MRAAMLLMSVLVAFSGCLTNSAAFLTIAGMGFCFSGIRYLQWWRKGPPIDIVIREENRNLTFLDYRNGQLSIR
jgi:hypothetical protein